MDLLQRFLEILRLDEPKALDHLDSPDTVSWEEFREVVREKRALQMGRDAYRDELLRGGETMTALLARVDMYKRGLKARVRASA